MARGHIRQRGKGSWEIRYAGRSDQPGKRKVRTLTVRGKRADAERKLVELLRQRDTGTNIDPSRTTLGEYLETWLGEAQIGPKTRERYRGLIRHQIAPHLGSVILQQLGRDAVKRWHRTLRETDGPKGRRLADRTILHAHRVLAVALGHALELNLVASNVAADISQPKVTSKKAMAILRGNEPRDVLAKLAEADDELHAIAHLALSTGARRGELCALRWSNADLEAGAVRIVESLEALDDGSLRFKPPKTAAGVRTITIPPATVQVLRDHRRRQWEQRLMCGLGKPAEDALVFSGLEGEPVSPKRLTERWRRAVTALDLPRVGFHALRHTHASALIASGLDVVLVSKRLGHGNPSITLSVYAHLYATDDRAAAMAIAGVLG